MVSAGFNSWTNSLITVNGTVVVPDTSTSAGIRGNRGISLIVVNPYTLEVEHAKVYDVYAGSDFDRQLNQKLKEVKDSGLNRYLALVV